MSACEPLTEAQLVEEITTRAKLKLMARMIVNNKHFQQVLASADPMLRRDCYDEITPHLRFKPKPFFLMKFRKPKACQIN